MTVDVGLEENDQRILPGVLRHPGASRCRSTPGKIRSTTFHRLADPLGLGHQPEKSSGRFLLNPHLRSLALNLSHHCFIRSLSSMTSCANLRPSSVCLSISAWGFPSSLILKISSAKMTGTFTFAGSASNK